MKHKPYIVIHCGEDGISITNWSKEGLLADVLNPEEPYFGTLECFTEMPDSDPQYWGTGLLILKGDIVQPRIVKKVTQYEVD